MRPRFAARTMRAFVVLELLFSNYLWQTVPLEPSKIGTLVPLSQLARDSKMVKRGDPPKGGTKSPGPEKEN